MSSTGTTICSSIRLSLRGCDDRDRPAAAEERGHLPGGRTVADSPIRCAGLAATGSRPAARPEA